MEERGWFDWLIGIFTISTGIVIAIAAFLTFVVQRARYKDEIQTELRFTNTWERNQLVFSDGFLRTVIWFSLTNTSPVRAFNLRLDGQVNWTSGLVDGLTGIREQSTQEWLGASREPELAPGDSIHLAIEFVAEVVPASVDPDVLARALTSLNIFGMVSVSYESPADVAHRFMTPIRSRFRYVRRRQFFLKAFVDNGAGAWGPPLEPAAVHFDNFSLSPTFTGGITSS